jgi:hypothetical protein
MLALQECWPTISAELAGLRALEADLDDERLMNAGLFLQLREREGLLEEARAGLEMCIQPNFGRAIYYAKIQALIAKLGATEEAARNGTALGGEKEESDG